MSATFKKGTTVLFALWPDHISALSDGRSTTTKYVNDEKFVHIYNGDEEKMCLLGNNIVCFLGVFVYSRKAYEMLKKEIGFGVIDKKVLTKAIKFVQKEYIEKFVKFPNDENEYAGFPGGVFIVGFDGAYYLGEQNSKENPKPLTFSHTIDQKEVQFVCCGGGACVALEYLKEQLKGQKEMKTIDEVSGLLDESLVHTSWYDECTGGNFQCVEYHMGDKPIFHEHRHLIEHIIKNFERLKFKNEICIPIFAEFHRDAIEFEYVFQQKLKAMLPKIYRIINLGGCDTLALRLLFFMTHEDFVEALEKLKGPPMIEEINGVAIAYQDGISKDFFAEVISCWEKENMF